MNILDKVMLVEKPKTAESQKIAYMYAAILVIFCLTQLFTFDKFLVLLESFGFPGDAPIAHLIGSIIVASEVLALPFLLRLKISRSMRVTSMTLGLLVPIAWLKISLWLALTASTVLNIGFFGTIIPMMPGWWAVFVSIALGILAAWASWGMWPFAAGHSTKAKN